MLPLEKRAAIAKVLKKRMTRRAVDFGNYTAIPTPDQVRCWIDAGYTRAIIGTSFSRRNADGSYTYVATDQIAVCEANGMDVEEYQFVGHLRPTTRRWWLDVELGESIDSIRAAVATGKPYGIYTRRGAWPDGWDIVSEFPDLKLWEAHYADPPPAFVPFGGWTERAMVQWHDSIDLCGLNVDLNIIEEDEMPEVTKGEFAALFGLAYQTSKVVQALGAGLIAVAQTAGTDHDELEKVKLELDELEHVQTKAAAAVAP